MFLKLAGVSAALAAFFVVALEAPSAQSRATAKLHYDRVAAEPQTTGTIQVAEVAAVTRVSTSASTAGADCRGQAWPYVDPACIGAERRPVRTITIERREAPNTSTLVRVPVDAK